MKKLFLLLLTAFIFIGCSSDDDTIYDFIGTWSGTYEGSDKGDFNFVVASDGKLTGTMHSTVKDENYVITGNVTDTGDLTGVIGTPSDGDFHGTLTREDKKGTGGWTNSVPTPTRAGTWTGAKNKQ
ncbi:hypothetical protein A0O34_19610 [Chryseobacterium glaciei]|uniref:Lipoprotein n=1 Tax=Chryseobacterium glaciei TaxID=1685010 RepID=A0A172Y044_9FLAO|nr:hypothetical protein [Chryseobacterium glaciei]ANF52584.1 hypothetical protein A0O34_19610 [Chryseobacterium glaciei]